MKTIKIELNREVFGSLNFYITKFIDELKSYFTNDVNILITNGNLASVLQYSKDYKLEMENIKIDLDGKYKTYKIGKLENIQMMVDPNMKWTDNRIILKNDDILIEEIEVIDQENLLM